MTPISLFYGIIVYMYTDKAKAVRVPHIHAVFKEEEAIISLDGDVLDGRLSQGKLRLVLAWLTIHYDDLQANWRVMTNGDEVFRIEPLR